MNQQEFMKQANDEQVARVLELKTAEELLDMAKEFDVDMTKEAAEETILKIADYQKKSGELSDDELDAVAGGATYKDTYMVVSCYHKCEYFRRDSQSYNDNVYCCECISYIHAEGVYLCTNDKNRNV